MQVGCSISLIEEVRGPNFQIKSKLHEFEGMAQARI